MASQDLRVLHVLEALEGGTARHLVDVVRATGEVEHHTVIPPRRKGGITDLTAPPALSEAGARVHLLPMTRVPWSGTNLLAIRRIRSLVTRVDPHVLHVHSSIGGLLGRLAGLATGVPVVYTPNGIATQRPAILVERALGRRTDRLVAVSPSEAELARRLKLVGPGRVVVVPNGIDLDTRPPTVDLRGRLGVDPSTRLIGSIARLVPQKAPEVFVDACARVAAHDSGVEFVLIGDGALSGEVEGRIAERELGDRFHLVPDLPGAAGIMEELSVFVLASRFEGAPYAPMEAMRAGTPVVLTDVVGNRDLVPTGTEGRLVPVDDADSLADAVLELLRDSELVDRMTAAATAHLQSQQGLDVMGARLRDVYQAVSGALRR